MSAIDCPLGPGYCYGFEECVPSCPRLKEKTCTLGLLPRKVERPDPQETPGLLPLWVVRNPDGTPHSWSLGELKAAYPEAVQELVEHLAEEGAAPDEADDDWFFVRWDGLVAREHVLPPDAIKFGDERYQVQWTFWTPRGWPNIHTSSWAYYESLAFDNGEDIWGSSAAIRATIKKSDEEPWKDH